MRKPSFVALAVSALGVSFVGAGCSSEQTPECVEYVECVQVVDLLTQTDTSPVWSQYDEGGDCWGGDPLTAQACTAGCLGAVETVRQTFDDVPVQCGGDFVLPALKVTETIGAEGGTVEVLGLSLEVPAGALAEDVEITVVNTTSLEEQGGAKPYSHVYRFEPAGLTFASPLAVTFHLPAFAREEGASVYWTVAGDDTTFEELSGTIEGEGITAHVTHFSRGFAGRPSGDVDLDAGPAPDAGDRDAGQPPRDSGVIDGGPAPVDGGEDPGDDAGDLDGGPAPGEDAGDLDGGPAPGDGGSESGPFITWVDPDIVAVGSEDTVITLTGGNFASDGWAVIFGDIALHTTWISAESATAIVPAVYLTAAGTIPIGWFNPNPFERADEVNFAVYDDGSGPSDGGTTDAGAFDGGQADPDGPTVYGVDPAEVRAGSGDLLIAIRLDDATLTASLNQIRVTFTRDGNSTLLGTLYRTTDVLYAWIAPSFLTTPGEAVIKVGAFGTGDSAGLQFRIVEAGNGLPTVVNGAANTITRAGVTAEERTLVVNGTGFVSGAKVLFKYWDTHSPVESVNVLSDTQLEVVLTPRQAAAAGTFPIAVQNPPPGGGASPGFTTWVTIGGTNPAPTLTSVEPAQVVAGQDTFVSLYGTGFLPDFTEVRYAENASIGRCIIEPGDPDVCRIEVPAGVATTAGEVIQLFVRNDTPGGGTSGSVQLNVVAP